MGDPIRQFTAPVAQTCRNVALGLIAGLDRSRSVEDVDAALARRSGPEQAVIVGGVLALLLLFSFVASQFGWIGLLLYWLAVIVVVN